MDSQKDEEVPSGTPPSDQNLPAEAEVQSVEPPASTKKTRKKRAASEGLEGEEGENTVSSTKSKSRAKKRNFGSEKEIKSEGGNAIKPHGALGDAGEEESVPASTKKRKTPKLTSGQKGNWSKEEDNIIFHSKKAGKGWQEITDLVRQAGSSESDRTLTAVRLRYQKVLKDRDVELTAEELGLLQQAKIDIETTEKYRFIVERYKELSGGKELSKGLVKRTLASAKSEFSVMKGGGESTRG